MPNRRWFRFSLRTFLVAFTAVAVWLGWNVHLVQRRKDFIASLQAPYVAIANPEPSLDPLLHQQMQKVRAILAGHRVFANRQRINRRLLGWHSLPYETREPQSPTLPWIRRLLGDESYWVVSYVYGPPTDRACELFPEATVMGATDAPPHQ
jgi:hypothetical protein